MDLQELHDKLHQLGWSIASHHDMQVRGRLRTFYLLTHPSGIWVKGDGPDQLTALTRAYTAAQQRLEQPRGTPLPPISTDVESLPQFLDRLQQVDATGPFITLAWQDFAVIQNVLPCILAADKLAATLARVDTTQVQLQRAEALVPDDLDETKTPSDHLNELLVTLREAQAAAQDAATLADNMRYRYQWERHEALQKILQQLGLA